MNNLKQLKRPQYVVPIEVHTKLKSVSRKLTEEFKPIMIALTNEQKEEFQNGLDDFVNMDSEDEAYENLETLENNIDKIEDYIHLG